jgi:hypothetical protein
MEVVTKGEWCPVNRRLAALSSCVDVQIWMVSAMFQLP